MQAAEAAALAGRCGEALDRWYESAALNDFVITANNMAVGWLTVEACRSSVGWPSASTALSMLEVSFLASTEPMVMFNLGSIYASGGVRLPYPEAASDFLFHGIRRAKHLNAVTPEVHERLMLRLAVVDPKRAEQARAETDYSELEHSQWRRATVERLTKQRAAEAIRTRSTPRVPVLAYRSSDSDVPDLKARFEEADRQFTATSNCVAWVKQHENVNFPAAWNNTGIAYFYGCQGDGWPIDKAKGLALIRKAAFDATRPDVAALMNLGQMYYIGGHLYDGTNEWVGRFLLLQAHRLAVERNLRAGILDDIANRIRVENDAAAASALRNQTKFAAQRVVPPIAVATAPVPAANQPRSTAPASSAPPATGGGPTSASSTDSLKDALGFLAGVALIVLAAKSGSNNVPMAALAAPGRGQSPQSPQPTQRQVGMKCTSDYECGVGQQCQKPVGSFNGVCVQRVDPNSMMPIDRKPRLDSWKMETKEACFVDTDCPIGFRCNRALNACIK